MSPIFSPSVLLAIGFGGGLGSILRYLVSIYVARGMGTSFPWGTLLINVTGSFLIGILAALFALRWNPDHAVRAFLIIGICGGYTTFSTFSLDAVTLIERGDTTSAFLYMASSVVCSLGGLFLATRLMRLVFGG